MNSMMTTLSQRKSRISLIYSVIIIYWKKILSQRDSITKMNNNTHHKKVHMYKVEFTFFSISQYSDGLRAERSGFNSEQCKEICLYSTDSRPGSHPVSYLMSTGIYFPGSNAAVLWSWPLSFI
jgi:hypothetical protein